MPGAINFGDLRRIEPVSRDFGTDRGGPIDRYHMERFLEARSADALTLEISESRHY